MLYYYTTKIQQMTTENSPIIYECNMCNYLCSKLSDYKKHLHTRKHVLTISKKKING